MKSRERPRRVRAGVVRLAKSICLNCKIGLLCGVALRTRRMLASVIVTPMKLLDLVLLPASGRWGSYRFGRRIDLSPSRSSLRISPSQDGVQLRGGRGRRAWNRMSAHVGLHRRQRQHECVRRSRRSGCPPLLTREPLARGESEWLTADLQGATADEAVASGPATMSR